VLRTSRDEDWTGALRARALCPVFEGLCFGRPTCRRGKAAPWSYVIQNSIRRQRGFAALLTTDVHSSHLPNEPGSRAPKARLTVFAVRSPQDFERNTRSGI
jgi:hypothetical protein